MQKITLTIIILVTTIHSLFSQTINQGEVVISPSTLFSVVNNFNNTSSATLINNGEVIAYNHWTNDGVVDHDNNGITVFQGANVQNIAGIGVNYLYNVEFNNTSVQPAFLMTGEISVANECSFVNGIVDNNSGAQFVFEHFADHSLTSDNSYVSGKVTKIGDNAFHFPIGDEGYYRYAEISAPENAEDTFTAKYVFNNPGVNYPLDQHAGVIQQINNQEYWIVTKEDSNSNVILTLSWDEFTTTPSFITSEPNSAIHIVRWDDEAGFWKDEGGVVDQANRTVSTPLVLEDYGVFTLARVREEIILPGNIVINNGISPNGDGRNDFFYIDNIENMPNNKVEVYNRWGAKVFSVKNYDNVTRIFEGISDNSLTVGSGYLPTGTYFYILEYDFIDSNGDKHRIKKVDYLYLNTD